MIRCDRRPALAARNAANGVMTVLQMRDHVNMSHRHMAKQERIISRLTRQGHLAMLPTARAMLTTMQEHLAFQMEMLHRMERDPSIV